MRFLEFSGGGSGPPEPAQWFCLGVSGLSEAPIKDLGKALGLNEKFLYINELFNGDVEKFQSSIKILNEGDSFTAARVHIESALIEQHQWMKKLKKPVAKEFVKLVRRRYL